MGERIPIVLTSPFVLFHSVTCYTNSIVSRIHVNITKLRNTIGIGEELALILLVVPILESEHGRESQECYVVVEGIHNITTLKLISLAPF